MRVLLLILTAACGDNLNPPDEDASPPLDAVSAPDAAPGVQDVLCDREEVHVTTYPDGVTIVSRRYYAILPLAGEVTLCDPHCLGDSCGDACPPGATCQGGDWRPPIARCHGPVAIYTREAEAWAYCGAQLQIDSVFGDDFSLGFWYGHAILRP